MKKTPPHSTTARYKITMLVDDQHTHEKSLSAETKDEAVRRAVRWVVTQMGAFRQGQNIKIVIVKVETLGEAISIRTFKTRPLGIAEAVSDTARIRLPRGTKYRSAHPQMTGLLVAKRSYITVTGHKTLEEDQDVQWRGNGGYVCWTDKEKVEIVIE
jgi:hypothetical protein